MVKMGYGLLDDVQKDFSDRKLLMGKFLPNRPDEAVILCVWKKYEFVTWNIYKKNGVWDASTGHYFSDLQEALNDFYER